MSFPFANAVIFQDLDGNRLAAKFYLPALLRKESQIFLEKQLHDKLKSTSSKSEVDVMFIQDMICVYKSSNDVRTLVLGSCDESALVLSAILETIFDSLTLLIQQRGSSFAIPFSNMPPSSSSEPSSLPPVTGLWDKRSLIENIDLVLLVLDEVLDRGFLLESDASSSEGPSLSTNQVMSRVLMNKMAAAISTNPDAPSSLGQPASSGGGDLTIAQALSIARDQLFAR